MTFPEYPTTSSHLRREVEVRIRYLALETLIILDAWPEGANQAGFLHMAKGNGGSGIPRGYGASLICFKWIDKAKNIAETVKRSIGCRWCSIISIFLTKRASFASNSGYLIFRFRITHFIHSLLGGVRNRRAISSVSKATDAARDARTATGVHNITYQNQYDMPPMTYHATQSVIHILA